VAGTKINRRKRILTKSPKIARKTATALVAGTKINRRKRILTKSPKIARNRNYLLGKNLGSIVIEKKIIIIKNYNFFQVVFALLGKKIPFSENKLSRQIQSKKLIFFFFVG
jgi:hypothetical protein